MTKINAFLKLIRWANVLIIASTQSLFFYLIKASLYRDSLDTTHQQKFVYLLLSYVCISSAGYIINDYFDLNIDQINKQKKVIINRFITRRWALFLHISLSLIGIVLSTMVNLEVGFLSTLVVIILFAYSAIFKKKFLIGNILVAVCVAWAIAITAYFDFKNIVLHKTVQGKDFDILFNATLLYVAFSFIINLIREVIKDMEDIEGDIKYGCKTMPIVWGINASKVFVAVWLVVLMAMLVTAQIYAIRLHWWLVIPYCLLFVLAPIVWVFKQLFTAQSPYEFHKLSSAIKIVILTGVLSMVFFKIYL